jgi:hypothetical protein
VDSEFPKHDRGARQAHPLRPIALVRDNLSMHRTAGGIAGSAA